jgi:hypothetical protein
MSIPYLIPSFKTLFDNLKLLEPCCNILKTLIHTDTLREMKTIQRSFQYYFQHEKCLIEVAESDLQEIKPVSRSDHFRLAYVQLWIFCFRNFPLFGPIQPKVELGTRNKPKNYQENPIMWQKLGAFVVELGFLSPKAVELSHSDAIGDLIRQFLRLAHPDLEPEKHIVEQIKGLVNQDQDTEEVHSKISDDIELPVARRTGRPYEDDYKKGRYNLFLPEILRSNTCINVSFTRRDILQSFFGLTNSIVVSIFYCSCFDGRHLISL